MPRQSVDGNLLFGILALQNNFVTRESLLAAFNAWVASKEKTLGHLLVEQGKLSKVQFELLQALTEEHIKQHGNDPQQSLAALSSDGGVIEQLKDVTDEELHQSLLLIGKTRPESDDLLRTETFHGSTTSDSIRFRIVRPHASGGLGEVFIALDGELQREVALKRIKPQYADDADSRERFQREAAITGGLEHPGIVPVYGLGTYADGRPFYAMRLIRGQTLKEEVARFHHSESASEGKVLSIGGTQTAPLHPTRFDIGERAVAFRKLLQRFIDICEAIHYAHSRGVLHRDLKPGNVMVGRYGETLVVDWGLAKILGSDSPADKVEPVIAPASRGTGTPTIAGSAIGTPAYMSPEQAAGRLDILGPRSDVYSLGATLYTILTGRPPFEICTEQDDVGQLLNRVQRGEFVSPRSLCPLVPKPMDAICLKAMATEPEARYASAKELAQEVERFLADEPIHALTESQTDRLARFARRNKGYVLAGVTCIAAIALVSLAANYRINHQKRLAQKSSHEEEKAKLRALGLADEKMRLASEMAALAAEKTRLADSERAARELADRRLRQSTAERLAAQSLASREENPIRAGLLAIEAMNTTQLRGGDIIHQARAALSEATDNIGGNLVGRHKTAIRELAVSKSGRWLAAASISYVRIWNQEETGGPGDGHILLWGENCSCCFSPNGRWLIASSPASPRNISCWDIQSAGFPLDPPRQLRCEEGITGAPRFGGTNADLYLPISGGVVHQWNLDLPNCVESRRIVPVDRIVTSGPTPAAVFVIPPKADRAESAVDQADQAVGIQVWQTDVDAQQPTTGSFVVSRFSMRNNRDSAVLAGSGTDRIAVVSRGVCRVFDGMTNAPRILAAGQFAPTDVRTATMDFQGRWLAVGTANGLVRLWDLTPEATVAPPLALAHPGKESTVVEFSPDGRWLFQGLRHGVIRIWIAPDFRHSMTLHGHESAVREFEVSPDNRWLFSGSEDGVIRKWDLSSTDPQRASRVTSSNSLSSHAATSPDGRWVASYGVGATSGPAVTVYDLMDLQRPVAVIPEVQGTFFQNFVFSSDSRYLAVFDGRRFPDGGSVVHLLDLDLPNPPGMGLRLEAGFGIGSVAFSADSKSIVAVQSKQTADRSVRVWRLDTRDPQSELLIDSGQRTSSAGFWRVPTTFSPDGNHLLLAEPGRLTIIGASLGTPASHQQSVSVTPGRALSLRYVPAWKAFLIVSSDRKLHTVGWPDTSVRQQVAWEGDLPVYGDPLCVSPDGRWGVIKQVSNRVPLIDFHADSVASALRYLDGHSEYVEYAAFSGDSKHLVTGSSDQTVRVWNLQATQPSEDQRIIRAGNSTVRSVGITPDGRWITAITADGALRRWEFDMDQLAASVRRSAGRSLTPEERVMFQLGEATVDEVNGLGDRLRRLLEEGAHLSRRENRSFSLATLKEWMLKLETSVEQLAMANGELASPEVDRVLASAREKIAHLSAIVHASEADATRLEAIPSDQRRELLPFRIQHLALDTPDTEKLVAAVQQLRALARGDGRLCFDCATWAATAARRIESNPTLSSQAIMQTHDRMCDIAIELLIEAASHGVRLDHAAFGQPSAYARDLDVLIGHPRLDEVSTVTFQ